MTNQSPYTANPHVFARFFAIFLLLPLVFCTSVQRAAASEWASPDNPVLVRVVQHLLNAQGLPTKVDGKYGSQTRKQVKSFQTKHQLKVTGKMDDKTWSALIITVKRGESGEAVQAVQELLNECDREFEKHPLKVTVDGVFGAKTEEAIKAFQAVFPIKVDGVVGPVTWKWLTQGASDNAWYD